MKIQVKGLVQTPNSVLLYHGPNGLDAPGGDADISDHLLGRSRSGGHVESMTRTFDEIAGKEYDDWKLLISVTNRSHTLLTQYFRRFSRDGAAFVECLAQDDNQPLDWFAITPDRYPYSIEVKKDDNNWWVHYYSAPTLAKAKNSASLLPSLPTIQAARGIVKATGNIVT